MKSIKEGLLSKFRMNYFFCSQQQEHDDEVLNYVCVDKKCTKTGLLCSICKQFHEGHTIFPLKMLLKKLQSDNQEPLSSSQSFQIPLQQLEEQHKILLFSLKEWVQKLAQKIRILEQHINEEYSKAKIELFEKVQMNMNLKSFLTDALSNKIKQKQFFKQQIKKISQMIQLDTDSKNPVFSTNLNQIPLTFKMMREKIQDKLNLFQSFIQKESFLVSFDQQQIHPEEKFYTFSDKSKAKNIQLNKKGKGAKQNKSGEGRFVLVNENIGKIKQKISFKVNQLKNWIGVGIVLKKKIQSLNYLFEYNNIGHGSYLVSSNGYTWSHSVKEKNIAVSQFKFVQGDIIDVQLEPGLVRFTNRSNNQKQILNIGTQKAQVQQYCFAVNLCSQGDSIEIVDDF